MNTDAGGNDGPGRFSTAEHRIRWGSISENISDIAKHGRCFQIGSIDQINSPIWKGFGVARSG